MTIDIIRYARLSNISLKQMLQLAKTLIRDKPLLSTQAIEAAAAELEKYIVQVEQSLTLRMAATNADLLASQADFDRALGGLWVTLKRLLELFEIYAHPGLAALSDVQQVEADLDDLQADAQRASVLLDRLFGADGTRFTSLPYPEQAETMATILRLIDHQGLLPEIEALVGPRLPRLLKVCQQKYEDMVSDRLTRDQGQSENLRDTRQQLRWLIIQYNTAVFGLAKYGDPASYEVVERALRAVTRIRPVTSNSSSNSEDYEEDLELIEDDELSEDTEDTETTGHDAEA